MNIEKQLETAIKTNHLVLVVFYADWSPHYEWIGPVLRTYEKRTVELIRVNAEDMKWLIEQKVDFITTNEPVILQEELKKLQ